MTDEGGQEIPAVRDPVAVQAEDRVAHYIKSNGAAELRQAEIITNLSQYEFDPATGGAILTEIRYAIVLAQDCDLLRDYEAAAKNQASVLNGALMYELQPAADARAQLRGVSWQPVTQNINERFHLLRDVPADCDAVNVGLPDLLLDFRRYFTLPPRELYRQCEPGQNASRRCRLATPYREHLQARAGFYFQRIALP